MEDGASLRHAPLLLGIDLGTSGVKAGLYDRAGRLIGLGRAAYPVERPRPGWAQTHPDAWWRGTCTAIRAALAEAHAPRAAVVSVGIGVLYPAVALVDAAGVPLSPAILYCDQRSIPQLEALGSAIPREEHQRLIGNVVTPGNCAVASMAWLRDELPDAWRACRWIAFASTVLLQRLTGEVALDPSMAVLSGLVDVREPARWSERLCSLAGIGTELLPPIRPSHAVAGHLTAAASAETGLAAGTPVACGCGDTPASALGSAVVRRGEAVCVSGSTDSVAVALERPTADPAWVNSTHAVPGTWLAIGTISSTGASVAWFGGAVLGTPAGEPAGPLVSDLAARSRPGAGGLVFLPYLQGERTPLWDPRARGVFFGLTSATTREDLARAVLEGTALALRSALERMDTVAGAPVAELLVTGGGAASATWNRIRADALGRRIRAISGVESGALGAALLAGVATGRLASFAEAAEVARAASPTVAFDPDPATAARYDERYRVFRELYPATRHLAHRLAEQA